MQIFGASGYTTALGVEAGLRDAVGGTIYSGTSEIQRNRIAATLGLREAAMSLAVTEFLDHDAPAVRAFVERTLGDLRRPPRELAVELYHAIRDGIGYEIYGADLSRAGLRASSTVAVRARACACTSRRCTRRARGRSASRAGWRWWTSATTWSHRACGASSAPTSCTSTATRRSSSTAAG